MYELIITVGITLIILAYVFIPSWMVLVSFLSFAASFGYYMKYNEENVSWVSLVFYMWFMYSWYNSSSFVTDNTRAWIQLLCVFSLFILFVYFKHDSIWDVFKWTFVLLFVAFMLSMVLTVIVKLAGYLNLLMNVIVLVLFCVGLYVAAIQFPSYFDPIKILLSKLVRELHTTKPIVAGVLLVEIIVVLFYYYRFFTAFYYKHHRGHLLLNQPMDLSQENTLNLVPKFVYNYALSGWFWINSVPSNQGYMTIMNYGNIPNITYSPLKNKIRITIKEQTGSNVNVCEIPEVPLQKWNHILINNNRGIMDVFLNGKLYKSIEGIVPYKSTEFVKTGEVHGIQGGVCNVMYFEEPLEISKIKKLYHSFKNYNPPVV